MRRRLSLPLAASLLAALFAGCAAHNSPPAASANPQQKALQDALDSGARLRQDPAAARAALTANSADYAWVLFLALNSPLNGNTPKLWETYFRQTSTVYLADGAAPPPWGQQGDPPDLPPLPPNGCVPAGVRHNLDTDIQVDGRDLLDKWNQSVRYQLLMNQPTFDYIVSRQFYNVNGQELAAQQGQPANFPSDAYELKTSWLWLGTDTAKCAEVQDKYLVVNAYYQLFDRDGLPSGWQVGYAALAGMHIINKALPQWVWITFENVYNPQFTAAKLELPLSPAVTAANQRYQGLLAGNVFANYQLDGVQTTFTEPGAPSQPTLLANSTIESIFQQQSSCITCHSLASIKADGEYFNLAYTQDGNLNYYVGTPPSLAGFNFLDFVWSMKRASRQRTVAAAGPEAPESKEGAR